MTQEWYYTKNGERQGPLTSQQLKQLAASGELQPTALIWKAGMAEWKPAKSVKGLFQATSQSKALVPPPITGQSKTTATEATNVSTEEPGLLKGAQIKFASLKTPQKILVGCLGSMGAFFFLCMGTCGLFGFIGGGFDEVRQVARDAQKEGRQYQASTPDQSDEPEAPVFSEGLAIVKKEGVWCVVDEEMTTLGKVGANELAFFRPFSNGRAVFFVRTGNSPAVKLLYGAIDRKGTVVIPPEFSRLTDFSDDRAVVWKGRSPENQSGIIDQHGKFILPLTKQLTIGNVAGGVDAMSVGYSEGLVFFWRRSDLLGGFLDTEGRVAISPDKVRGGNSSPGIFSEGLAAVQRGVSEAEYRSGFLPAGATKIGYIDRTGNQVIKPQFSKARVFSEGLAAVKRRDEKWGYIDKTGKMVIEPEFDSASPFKDGKASVTLDGNEKMIDRTGHVVR
jgi:GYF domain 2/WG containing repeat